MVRRTIEERMHGLLQGSVSGASGDVSSASGDVSSATSDASSSTDETSFTIGQSSSARTAFRGSGTFILHLHVFYTASAVSH